MAILDTIGTGVQNGATPPLGTWTNYIPQRVTYGGVTATKEDVEGSFGELITRLIFRREKTFTVDAVCKTAAAPETDFPMEDMATLTGLTAYYVDDLKVGGSKGATTISVTLTLIGIT